MRAILNLAGVTSLAVLTLTTPFSNAHAQSLDTGSWLADTCNANQDDSSKERSFCFGYLRGLFDGLHEIGQYQNSPTICTGAVTAAALREIYVRWLAANPDWKERPSSLAASAAFSAAFPCTKKPGAPT